jgi:hypothetical protein
MQDNGGGIDSEENSDNDFSGKFSREDRPRGFRPATPLADSEEESDDAARAERAGGQLPTAQMQLKSILKKVAKLNICYCTQSLSLIFYTAEQLQ